MGSKFIEAAENFEYKKNNNRYQDEAKLHKQVVKKALPIVKTFYPGYSLYFLFNNVTSHSVDIKNVLQIKKINKGVGRK